VIRPMHEDLSELWRYRELLWILVQRDLKVRYKNSVLGFGWSLVNPLLQVLIITVVIKMLMDPRQVPDNYHVYVFCATLPWLFFSTAVMDSSLSLLQYQDLIRRVYFPRSVLPLATVIANLIHFVLATLVFVAYCAANSVFWWVGTGKLNWPIPPTAFLLPLPMLGLTLLMGGVALFISIWTLYFADIRFLADSGMRILYWLVPVLYFPETILRRNPLGRGPLLYNLYMLNPLSGFISAFRKLALVPTTTGGQAVGLMGPQDWLFLLTGLVISLALALGGHRYFCSRQWKLAERP
jgi:lipopolysaccharide transport system permease protein